MDRYTEQQLIDAIDGSRGIISNIAKTLGCEWHTANDYVKKYELQYLIDIEREKLVDKSENVIGNAVDCGDVITAKWVVGKLGHKRGYVDKSEVDNNISGDININVNIKEIE